MLLWLFGAVSSAGWSLSFQHALTRSSEVYALDEWFRRNDVAGGERAAGLAVNEVIRLVNGPCAAEILYVQMSDFAPSLVRSESVRATVLPVRKSRLFDSDRANTIHYSSNLTLQYFHTLLNELMVQLL